jgi:hypothetical protein
MSAEQFDQATPREVQWRIDARERQDDDDWQRTAQLASWVLTSIGTKVSANKLLGKPEPFRFDW